MGNKEKRNKIKFRIGKLTFVEIKGLGVDTRNKIWANQFIQLHQSLKTSQKYKKSRIGVHQ